MNSPRDASFPSLICCGSGFNYLFFRAIVRQERSAFSRKAIPSLLVPPPSALLWLYPHLSPLLQRKLTILNHLQHLLFRSTNQMYFNLCMSLLHLPLPTRTCNQITSLQMAREVTLATMTDLQQAIKQLSHEDDFDGSRSFTFSSSHGGSADHNTDTDADGKDCQKTARHKLAENAKMATEEQATLASTYAFSPSLVSCRLTLKMSGDSRNEDESPGNGILRRHSHFPEEKTAPAHPLDPRWLSDSSSAIPPPISASPTISGSGRHLHLAHSALPGVNVKSPSSPYGWTNPQRTATAILMHQRRSSQQQAAQVSLTTLWLRYGFKRSNPTPPLLCDPQRLADNNSNNHSNNETTTTGSGRESGLEQLEYLSCSCY